MFLFSRSTDCIIKKLLKMVINCAKCTKVISPRSASLKCHECSGWYHSFCIELPAEQIDVYLEEAKKEGKRFICPRCIGVSAASSPLSGRFHDANSSSSSISLSSLHQMMERMMVMMDDRFGAMEGMISDIQCKTMALYDRIDAIERRVEVIEVKTNTSNAADVCMADVISEIEDRKTRESNLILFGMPESADADGKSDAVLVTDKLRSIKSDVNVIKVFRLGRKKTGQHPRPVKAVLTNNEDVKSILKSKIRIDGVSIRSDCTPMQLSTLRKLKQELDERKRAGENNLRIKFTNNNPKIIRWSPRQSEQEN